MLRRAIYLTLALVLSHSSLAAKDPVDYVDPFIGTGHQGKDFPGASTPFSMVKISPDTIVSGPTGYSYFDKTVQGFGFDQLGGADGGELGNFLVMATTGILKTYGGDHGQPGTGYLSSISKSSEKATPGYYSVMLDDYQIKAEATVATHSGIMRFTFPENDQSRIQIDLAHRLDGTSVHQTIKVVNDHTIEGEIDCTKDSGGWRFGGDIAYKLYYHAEFSRPFTKTGVWSATLPDEWNATPPIPYGRRMGPFGLVQSKTINDPDFIDACKNAEVIPDCPQKDGQHLGFFTEFATQANDVVMVKAGLSFVSTDGARANLAAEIPAWNFDQVQQQARETWTKALDRLAVEGGTEDDKTIYYSALYRTLLFPMTFADANGDYTGGDHQIHHTTDFTNVTIFSGWDDYRSEYPLLTLIDPKVVNDQINSMLSLAATNGTGYLDRWEIMGNYTDCMIGNPEVVVINDAWQKGIRGFDSAKAFTYCLNTTQKYGNSRFGYSPGNISETNEYGLCEWNMADFAAALGHQDAAAKYSALSEAYQQLFNPDEPWTYDAEAKDFQPQWKGWFCAKDSKGQFLPWPGLLSPKYTREATVYQAGWTAYNDIPGMIELLGGNEQFTAKLDDFFSRTPDFSIWNPYLGTRNPAHIYGGQEPWWNPYNNPVNEPTELIGFLFNWSGAPWLTQKWVRESMRVYYTGPEGLPGDDDVGQMSAWYVLCAIGLHQSCPGNPRFEIFSPLFDKVTLKLDPRYTKGETFIITAKNNSPDNVYIQSAALNGKPLDRCWLDYSEIAAGGTLALVMGPAPNKSWGLEMAGGGSLSPAR
jgi:predicted alpha-1,2-mannosidase